MLINWDTVKVHIWEKALLQMRSKFTKLINTLGFFVFIIFEDLSLLFSNLMVCQRSGKMLCPLKSNFLLKSALKLLSLGEHFRYSQAGKMIVSSLLMFNLVHLAEI